VAVSRVFAIDNVAMALMLTG